MILIVEEAARDTLTALSLALVSKAVGRMAESVLYASVTLRSLASGRSFVTAMRTKSRLLLAGVADLTLSVPAPRDYEDFWTLVDKRCTKIVRLSLCAVDLDAIRGMRLQPHHITVLGGPPSNPSLTPDDADHPSQGPWDHVSHLYLPNYPSTLLVPLLESGPAARFSRLTHFSCAMSLAHSALALLLALPTLRVCIVASSLRRGPLFVEMFLQSLPQGERRLVTIFADDIDNITEDAPYWEFAERKIAERRQ
jgi:hypothetical protein